MALPASSVTWKSAPQGPIPPSTTGISGELLATTGMHRRNRAIAHINRAKRICGVPIAITSDAPAVFFGVLKSPQHFLMQILHERRSAHRLRAGFRDVRGAIAAAEDAHQRLLHPIGFQAEPKRIAQ